MTLQKDDTIGNQKKDNNSSKSSSQYEQIKQMFDFWTEITKLPTIGPFSAYSKDAQIISQKTGDVFGTVMNLQANLGEYWSQITQATLVAIQNLSKSAPNKYSTKEDFEKYRKMAIDAFENSFSQLFDSREFAVTYGKVFSNQLDLVKQIKDISESNLRALNIPTQSQYDDILKDIHDLKMRLREAEKKLERNEKEKKENGARNSTAR